VSVSRRRLSETDGWKKELVLGKTETNGINSLAEEIVAGPNRAGMICTKLDLEFLRGILKSVLTVGRS
jgi:hypothetical protein